MTTRGLVGWIVNGDAGAVETLHVMQRLVRAAVLDPSFVWWSREICQDCVARDEYCLALVIRQFVDMSVKFVRDPVGVESLTSPLTHMKKLRGHYGMTVGGDCDDAATLSAALGLAVGLPARFVVIAFPVAAPIPGEGFVEDNAPYQHVFTELYAAGQWREMDTTKPLGIGPIRIVRRLTFNV